MNLNWNSWIHSKVAIQGHLISRKLSWSWSFLSTVVFPLSFSSKTGVNQQNRRKLRSKSPKTSHSFNWKQIQLTVHCNERDQLCIVFSLTYEIKSLISFFLTSRPSYLTSWHGISGFTPKTYHAYSVQTLELTTIERIWEMMIILFISSSERSLGKKKPTKNNGGFPQVHKTQAWKKNCQYSRK